MHNLPSILYTFPKILTGRIFLISISLLNSELWNNEVFINISVLKLFSQKNLEPNGGFSLLNMIVQSVHLICRVIEKFPYVMSLQIHFFLMFCVLTIITSILMFWIILPLIVSGKKEVSWNLFFGSFLGVVAIIFVVSMKGAFVAFKSSFFQHNCFINPHPLQVEWLFFCECNPYFRFTSVEANAWILHSSGLKLLK